MDVVEEESELLKGTERSGVVELEGCVVPERECREGSRNGSSPDIVVVGGE